MKELQTVPTLINALRFPESHPFNEIRELMENKAEASKALLRIFQDPAQTYETMLEEEDDSPFYAMFILAGLKDQRFYPLLIELLRYNEDDVDEFWGALLFEICPRLILSTYNGDLKCLQSLVRDTSVDHQVRCAALDAFANLYAHGFIKRDVLVAEISYLIKSEGGCNETGNFLHNQILYTSTDLQLREFEAHCIESARGALSDAITEKDVVEAYAADPTQVIPKYVSQPFHKPIDDVLAEIKAWEWED